MTKTVWKWYFVWDFEKEEEWLNEMAEQGWILSSVGWCRYTFTKGEPGEYTIRLEMRGYDQEYISFMEETGAEYIGRVLQWLYFRKPASEGSFDLYSDIDSRIAHLKRIAFMLKMIGIANLLIGIANSLNSSGVGILNLLCAALLMYGLGRIDGKIESLQRDRLLRE